MLGVLVLFSPAGSIPFLSVLFLIDMDCVLIVEDFVTL